jgi:hypothetical protein
LLCDPRLLDRAPALRGDAFDRRDFSTLYRRDGRLTGPDRLTVQVDRACTALSDTAAELGPGECEVLSKNPQQRMSVRNVDLSTLTVE